MGYINYALVMHFKDIQLVTCINDVRKLGSRKTQLDGRWRAVAVCTACLGPVARQLVAAAGREGGGRGGHLDQGVLEDAARDTPVQVATALCNKSTS